MPGIARQKITAQRLELRRRHGGGFCPFNRVLFETFFCELRVTDFHHFRTAWTAVDRDHRGHRITFGDIDSAIESGARDLCAPADSLSHSGVFINTSGNTSPAARPGSGTRLAVHSCVRQLLQLSSRTADVMPHLLEMLFET